jgi:Ca-activated chloride channel family protein
MRRFPFISLLLLSISALSPLAIAQTSTPTPKPNAADDEIIKVESRLIVVPVSVTDSNGQPVIGLRADSFQIGEDGKSQTIDQVTDAENTPLEIALLVDVSGSVNPLFEFEIKAAAQFLETVMKADDRATIFLIGDKPISAMARENSVQAAVRVRAIVPSGKFTAFYDTVSVAAKYLQKNAPVRSRRVIVALTDGEDNWSDLTREAEKATYRDIDVNKLTQDKRNQLAARTDTAHVNAQTKILRALQDADTVFYVINPAGDSYKLNKISKRAQIGMDRFANDTGGTAFLPKFVSTKMKDPLQNAGNSRRNEETLDRIFRQLASELRAQYLIQYYSESDFPRDKYVKLNVGLQNRSGVRVRARQGYFVKN